MASNSFAPRLLLAGVLLLALQDASLRAVNLDPATPPAAPRRLRAKVLIVDEAVSPAHAARVQAQLTDEINVTRASREPGRTMPLAQLIEEGLAKGPWDLVVLGSESEAGEVRDALGKIKTAGALALWASSYAAADTSASTRAAIVRSNDTARPIAREASVPICDLYATVAVAGVSAEARETAIAAALAKSIHATLLTHSAAWADLPVGETRDPAHLLAAPALLADLKTLRLAESATAMIYRAEAGQWQFNLHSFLGFYAGEFWAMWSSGRADEDSASQFLRYATSRDGLHWTEARTLAADPDGENGPLRWMASGLYVAHDKLFALGGLSAGGRGTEFWAGARTMRYRWTGSAWAEDGVLAEDCVLYYPPIDIGGRDFVVWRNSYGHFSTAFANAASGWTVQRLPGPPPAYRMSETSAYVDPQGVAHLIIRDQGGTHAIYHAVSYDAGATWTVPVKTNYPDAVSKNCAGRLSNGWYYLINNPDPTGRRDPLVISFSRDGWTFGSPWALRKDSPARRFPGKAKPERSFQYSHAMEHDGKLWVIYATNKEDIEVSAYPIGQFGLEPLL